MHDSSTAVLLVEDDPLTRERIELLLEQAGLGCVGVGSAAEARAALETLFFPIVVVDRMLGDGDGIDLIVEVKRLARDGRAHVLLLSALDSEADIAAGMAAGADDYLSKRTPDETLLEQLRRAAQRVRLPTTSRT